MGYVLIFGVGCFVGLVITAIAASSGQAERIQEAYNDGYEVGYKIGLKHRK